MGEKLAATFWSSLIGGILTIMCGAGWMGALGLQGGWLLVAGSLSAATLVTFGHFAMEWASDKAVDREMRKLNARLEEINAAAAPAQAPGRATSPEEKLKWN